MAGISTHAGKFSRNRRELRLLRVLLGRIVRDTVRKGRGSDLDRVFHEPLARARQIRSWVQRRQGFKIDPFHAPQLECVGKGKARQPSEFAVKASINTTHRRWRGRQFVLHAISLPAIPMAAIIWPARSAIPRRSPADRSSGCSSTRHTVAATEPIQAGSPAPAWPVAWSASTRVSCGADQRSRPPSATSRTMPPWTLLSQGATSEATNVVLSALGSNLRLIFKWFRA